MRNSCTYALGGTKTFRLASRQILTKAVHIDGKRKFKGWGGNMQNIEKSMREIYIPDEGKIFVQRDQSGAEALIVAYLCEAGKLRDLFINNVKPHVYVALRLFKDVWKKKMREHNLISADTTFDIDEIIATPIPQLKLHPLWRNLDALIKDSDNWTLTERYYYLAKQTCHSGNYDITPPTFRSNILEKSGGKIVISKDDSERFILTYQSLFEEISGYHRWVKRQVDEHKILYNLHGHPYIITLPLIQDSQWKELYAWIPQSTVGEITNIAFANLQYYIEANKLDWDLLENTHDSYLCQCPVGEERECSEVMGKFMNQSFKSPVDSVEFSMKSESQCGYNWAPAKKDKNLEGLKEL